MGKSPCRKRTKVLKYKLSELSWLHIFMISSGLLFSELMAHSVLRMSSFICFSGGAALPFSFSLWLSLQSAGFTVGCDAPQWELAYLNQGPLLAAVLFVSLTLVLEHSSEFKAWIVCLIINVFFLWIVWRSWQRNTHMHTHTCSKGTGAWMWPTHFGALPHWWSVNESTSNALQLELYFTTVRHFGKKHWDTCETCRVPHITTANMSSQAYKKSFIMWDVTFTYVLQLEDVSFLPRVS